MKKSEQINELATALAKAQMEISHAFKDSINPHFKSKYADLAAVIDACKIPLAKHGISVTQNLEFLGEKPVLLTTMVHASGQWIESCAPLFVTKQDSQGIGSALTYMRRYCLASMVGIHQEDDDGNSSCEKQNVHPKQELISDKQLQELKALLASCGTDYEMRVITHLKNSNKPIDGLDKLPIHLYESVKGAALKKSKEMVVANA